MGSRDRFITPEKKPVVEWVVAREENTVKRIQILRRSNMIGPTRSKNFISAANKIAHYRLTQKDKEAELMEKSLFGSLRVFETAVGRSLISRLIRKEGPGKV